MSDPTQIIFISAITIMTLVLTVVGIQLIFILKELRTFLIKANNIIKELEKLGGSISNGYSEIIGFFYGLRNLFKILDLISKKKDKNDVKK